MSTPEEGWPDLLQRLARAETLIEGHEDYDRLAHDSLARRTEDIQEQIRIAFDVAQLAADKAETALEKRLDSVNEFRMQLSDQAANFATKDLVETRFGSNGRRITVIENFQAKILGAIAVAVVVIPLFSGVIYYALGTSASHQHPAVVTTDVTPNVVTVTVPQP